MDIKQVCRFSFLIILLFISTILNAQTGVKIKEKVEIAPKQQISSSRTSSWELAPSFTCVMPFDGYGSINVQGYDRISPGDTKLILNGKTIFEDVIDLVEGGTGNVDLGSFNQGDILTFTMVHADGTPWPVQECFNMQADENSCYINYALFFTNTPICGQDLDHMPFNVNLFIGFGNTKKYEERILVSDMGGNYVFGERIDTRVHYASVCLQDYGVPLPEGTTFTFTITQGQEYAILQDINSGAEGTSLSVMPVNGGEGWIRLIGIGNEPAQPVYVTIEAQTSVPGLNTVSGQFELRPSDFKIIPTKSVMVYGDTLRFDVWKEMPDGSLGTFEDGTNFVYSIIEGNDAGYLYSPDSSQVDDAIYGGFSSAMFAAVEEKPQGDATVVKLWVRAIEPPPPCLDCIPSSIDPGKLKPVPKGQIISQKITDSKNGIKPTITLKNPSGLKKNKDGSYTYRNITQPGIPEKLQNGAKAANPTVIKPRAQAAKSNETIWEKNAYGGYSARTNNQKGSRSASSGDSTQYPPSDGEVAITTFKVIKSCIHAKFNKTPLSLGDTTDLEFTYTETGQPVPTNKLLDVSILYAGDTTGCLLSSLDSLNINLNGVDQPIRYIAPDSIQGDSLVVYIKAVESEANSITGLDAGAQLKSKAFKQQGSYAIKNGLQIVNTATIKGPNGKIIHPQSLSPAMIKALQENVCETKPKAGVVEKHTILLGETKYYYAVKDEKGNLEIKETTDSDLGSGISSVIMEDPIISENSSNKDKIGVYWDYLRPDGSGLDDGVIRLIGRYYNYDGQTTYNIKLHAVITRVSEADIEIEIKKPIKLGTTHNKVTDVYSDDYTIDNIIIEYAGKYGVPPQIIKGQIQRESSFQPSYRWEPFAEASEYIHRVGDNGELSLYMNNFLYQIKSINDIGKPGIPLNGPKPGHSNVQPKYYWGYQGTIWELLSKTSQIINPQAPYNIYKELNLYSALRTYEKKRQQTLQELIACTESPDENSDFIKDLARTTADYWLRYEYCNGRMNSIAQTRTASSYGFLQLRYTTARRDQNYPADASNRPEDLQIPEIVFKYAVPYLTDKKLKEVLDNQNDNIDSEWSLGWEKNWSVALSKYNDPSVNNATAYGIDIITFSSLYVPK